MGSEDDFTWGWENFFENVEVFLISCNREIGSCSSEYANFVVERLESCVQVISYITNSMAHIDDESEEMVSLYDTVRELLVKCYALVNIWQEVIDNIDSMIVSLLPSDGYAVSLTRHGVGRP